MDVIRVLELVRPFFESRAEPYAVVGGLALLAQGADYFDRLIVR
jgi:hypothetical protein